MNRRIRAVLFDIDDTLYVEGDFFRSGFASAAAHLESLSAGPADRAYDLLVSLHFDEGREGVFDKAAARLGFPAEWVPDLVQRFRAHAPQITLAPDAIPALERLRGKYKLGAVTDGHAEVQRRKVEALGLEPLLDALVVCDDHGRHRWKPDPFPFLSCCELLGVVPAEAAFVGDNPERDIRGARNAGLRCIRIRREGGFFRHSGPEDDPADAEITHLNELESTLARLEEESLV